MNPPLPDSIKSKDHSNKDPLHGITLKEIVTQLHANYGWEELALRIPIRCFSFEPSVQSTLKFLRKTPWARTKVEELYIKASKNWGHCQPVTTTVTTTAE